MHWEKDKDTPLIPCQVILGLTLQHMPTTPKGKLF